MGWVTLGAGLGRSVLGWGGIGSQSHTVFICLFILGKDL